MSDPLTKAAHYRERAEECFELAAIASDDQIRVQYKQLAENYLTLADAELGVGRPQATSIAHNRHGPAEQTRRTAASR